MKNLIQVDGFDTGRVAVISGNVVIAILENSPAIPNGVFSETAQAGDMYIDNTFVPTPLDTEELAQSIRNQRDALLQQHIDVINPVQWAAMPEQHQAVLSAYRQALLDVPQQAGFPTEVTFPQLPTEQWS